jgi:hypothetical protein
MGQHVALVLDFLDLVGLIPDRNLHQHIFQEARAPPQLFGQRDEFLVEGLVPGQEAESEGHGADILPFRHAAVTCVKNTEQGAMSQESE